MPVARWCFAAILLIASTAANAAEPAEFFEQKIRPLLVTHCVKCHGDDKATKGKEPKGGLRTDGRAALLKGGDNGPAVVPGDPAKSKLIEAIRYANTDMQMPPSGRLPDGAIRDLEQWVKDGAVWPNDTSAVETKNGFDLAKRKAEHWAWKPVQNPAAPTNAGSTPVDRFLVDKLNRANLTPAPAASKPTWLRRVTFALTGLPPTAKELADFDADSSPDAFAKVVDRLLASPQYGERWGRHWLDLVRFAESRGHEFEPDIPNAWQYRDYVIRALNADVPYDAFVREHLAGDVLPKPRLNQDGGNESILGSGFWHLGEEVHSPVDIRQDQADRFDNRIDVVTKTFLGLTVACARCHDHKFDAISTKDYYALYGIVEGSGYRQVRFDGWEQNRKVAAELAKLRAEVAKEIAGLSDVRSKGIAAPMGGYYAWKLKAELILDLSNPQHWMPDDVTFGTGPRQAGSLTLKTTGKNPGVRLEPYTAAMFDPFWAVLKFAPNSAPDLGPLGRMQRAGFSIRTPNFVLTKKNLYYLVRGGGMAYAAVDGHSILAGPLHAGLTHGIPHADEYRWVQHNLSGYVGQRVHVELTADPRTDFAVAAVIQSDEGPPEIPPRNLQLVKGPDAETLAKIVTRVTDAEKALAKDAKWESRTGLAQWDGTPVDETVFVRGNPRTPGAVVPHRSLEAIAGGDVLKHSIGSGRLELALQWTDSKQNPFVSRIAVNRVWHLLFGRGLVPTPDNFGLLGEAPTHPELLDNLATEFVKDGWSLKRLIRKLVLTDAYRMSSNGDPAADKVDPTNAILHKFRLKRLEGEAIRDSMLAVSGRLDPKMEGRSVPIFLTPFLDGRGRPGSGPIDGNGRRSLYLAVRRNFLSPFLLAFDTPIPFSTVGRRQVSNVPAQALILLNDPFVYGQAEVWAKAILAKPGTVAERIGAMYSSALGRSPTTTELETCSEFLKGQDKDEKAWADLGHMLFNVKEFIYVR